jgi:hypothetical protein
MLIRETFAAAVPKAFNHPGNYFRIKRATGFTAESLDCTFFKNGKPIDVDVTKADPGDFAFVPDGFDRVEVVSTIAQDVTIQIARGRVGSYPVFGPGGSFDVGYALSAAGVGYCTQKICGAVAAQYSMVQLWNPAASGKRAVIRAIRAACFDTAVDFRMLSTTVAFTGGTSTPQPLLLGGPACSMEIRQENAAALPGNWIDGFLAPISDTFQPALPMPFIVSPGKGLAVAINVLNKQLHCSFQLNQEPV